MAILLEEYDDVLKFLSEHLKSGGITATHGFKKEFLANPLFKNGDWTKEISKRVMNKFMRDDLIEPISDTDLNRFVMTTLGDEYVHFGYVDRANVERKRLMNQLLLEEITIQTGIATRVLAVATVFLALGAIIASWYYLLEICKLKYWWCACL